MRKFTITIALLCFLLPLFHQEVRCESRYALLTGISKYVKPDPSVPKKKLSRPGIIKDLNSSVNDVMAISSALQSRFAFPKSNITTLLNFQATRAGILRSLDALLVKCSGGDVAFFYYSGHGSQYPNKGSTEADKLDETLAPSDGIYAGRDIRDKELAVVFQKFVDKGVILTVVIDACHSGSIARGLDIEYKMVMAATDTLEDDILAPVPEKNGALILSAAQDFQVASARSYGESGWMSNFTKAFLDVLKMNKSDLPASEFKQAIEARLRWLDFSQVPVLAATDERRKQNLLGLDTFQEEEISAILEKVMPGNSLLLQGGLALGIDIGSELTDASGNVRVEVTTSRLNESTAKVLTGTAAALKPGTSFYLKKRAFTPANKLNVCLPVIDLSHDEFSSLAGFISKTLVKKNISVTGSIRDKPDYTLYYNKKKWYLLESETEHEFDDRLLGLDSVLKNDRSILVHLPLYRELYAALKADLNDAYSCVSATDYSNADYFVSGKMETGKLMYSVIKNLPDTAGDSEYSFQSLYIAADPGADLSVSKQFCEIFYKLAKTKTWLTLETPPDYRFPYFLTLENTETGMPPETGLVREGERYSMKLVKNARRPAAVPVEKRWVYVFYISSQGDIKVLYPDGDNIENYFPVNSSSGEIKLPSGDLSVGKPFGVDHLIMLTTAEAIPNPKKLEQEGVTTRGVNNPLEELIGMNNARTRGVKTVKAPDHWALQKIRFKSVPK